jgi:hypothetical protein
MGGLVFEIQQPVVASAPNRADIACFVGLVGRRSNPLPLQLRRWFQDEGWTNPVYGIWSGGLLECRDLTDPVGMAISLQDSSDSPAIHHLRQGLDRLAPRLLDQVETDALKSDRWQQWFLQGLNHLLQEEGLFDATAFREINLNAETQGLLARNLTGNQIVYLNRRLLEQVFSGKITPLPLCVEEILDKTLANLLDVPVPIDSWDLFDYLFAWDERYLNSQVIGTSYLGAAVRSFFAQGGTKCYVVRVGDPGFLLAPQTTRQFRLRFLLPGYPNRLTVTPSDRRTWRGIGHLFGLPDVSFLALPDLPDLLSVDRQEISPPDPLPLMPETFVECSEAEPLVVDSLARFLTAPRCDEQAYQEWAKVLNLVGYLLSQYGREVQLVAALPLPTAGSSIDQAPLPALLGETTTGQPLSIYLNQSPTGLASAFVQLVYPWVKTSGSTRLPEQLENPEGILVGVLARNALNQGAFRSAAGLGLVDVYEVFPLLSREQTESLHASKLQATAARHSLMERVSLLGLTPGGWRLCSDVTTSLDESYRPACVNRLVSSLVRAARRLGEEYTFENSGEFLWGRLRESLSSLLLGLLQAGALRGDTADDAFQVRCDRTTMTQADLDNGRVIIQVQFTPAVPIEQITVFLALNESGQVAVLPALPPAPMAA